VLAHKLRDLRARRAAGETGFTLVELLVVVVIIVALAAIAVPIFLNQKGKADEARLQSDATSAGKILASAVSQGAILVGDGTSTVSYDDQSVTSQGVFAVTGFSNGAWDAATACVDVTADSVVYSYKIQGGVASGTCASRNA
jgi:type IV pilus assembly protein PilA